jgi:hypothetical protein
MTELGDLVLELARKYDVSEAHARAGVNNLIPQLVDNAAMWYPAERLLTDAGADFIRDRFHDTYDESPNLLDAVPDGPLPEVTAQDSAAWHNARERSKGAIRFKAQQIEQTRRQLEALEDERDTGIRGALVLGIKPSVLAEISGLSAQRISQIRHGRR